MATVGLWFAPGSSDDERETEIEYEQPMLVIPRVWHRNNSKSASEAMKIEMVCRHVTHAQKVSIEQAITEAAQESSGTFDPWLALSYTGRLPAYKPTAKRSSSSASSSSQASNMYYRPLVCWFKNLSCSVELDSDPGYFNVTITFYVHKKGLPLSSTNAQSPFQMVLLWQSQSLALVSPEFRVDTSIKTPPDFDIYKFGEPPAKTKEKRSGISVQLPIPGNAGAVPATSAEIAALREVLRMQKVLQRIINPELLALQESTEHALGAGPDDSSDSEPAA